MQRNLCPIFFTFITAMVTLLILLEPRLRWNKILVYGAILFAGLTTHLSHIPLVFLVLISLVLLKYFKKVETTIRQWSVISAVIVAAFVFTCTYNAISGFGFRLSMASNVFITANLGEMGILKMYLDENCPNTSSELCAIKDDLPLETGGYLWDAEATCKASSRGLERHECRLCTNCTRFFNETTLYEVVDFLRLLKPLSSRCFK